MRLVNGFCIAGLYVVAESWINDRATNETPLVEANWSTQQTRPFQSNSAKNFTLPSPTFYEM